MTTIHVSPDGSDTNSGSRSAPLGSVRAGHDAAGPGDDVVIHDGLYRFDSKLVLSKSGEDGSPITMRADDGASPTFEWTGTDGGDRDSGLKFSNCSHWVLDGIEVKGSTWKGVNCNSGCQDLVWRNLDVHGNRSWGIMVNGGDRITIRNCDSHDNFDERNGGENSDGFNYTGPATDGLIENCRSWNNGDDGYDFWVSEGHTVRNCWAWSNGRGSNGDGNGFKLGGGPNRGGGHLVHHCVAYDNEYRGFDWNTTDNPLEVYNCTAVNNELNFRFTESGPYTLRNNVSVGGSLAIDGGVDDAYNSWNLGIDDPGFRSTDPDSDDFLRLADGSPAIGAGTDVGLPYSGSAPDLGAFQTESPDTGGGDASRSEPTGGTPNHGYNTPQPGQAEWNVPLNQNFDAIDRDVPVVDQDGARDEYEPMERTLYVAYDTGTVYVGDGEAWNRIGTLD